MAGLAQVPSPPTSLSVGTSITVGCGTDSNGIPTDNSQCGQAGTNPYVSEGAQDLSVARSIRIVRIQMMGNYLISDASHYSTIVLTINTAIRITCSGY